MKHISRDHSLPKHSSSYVDYLQQVWSCLPQVTTNVLCSTLTLLKEEYNCRQCIFLLLWSEHVISFKMIYYFLTASFFVSLFYGGHRALRSSLCVCFYFRHSISLYRGRLKGYLIWIGLNASMSRKNTVAMHSGFLLWWFLASVCCCQFWEFVL